VRIAILSNPRSGRNRAASLARGCVAAIRRRGHTPVERAIGDGIDGSCDRLIVVGGDGTVHHTLAQLVEHSLPFVHLPTGTANLIATEFAMPKRPEECVDWAIRGGTREIDVPTLDGSPFVIMINAGADAGVIHRFEHARAASGGYLNYMLPVTREVFDPRPARITLACDDETYEPKGPVNLTVANMRSSALGINPCHDADPTDQRLDIRVTPCGSTASWTVGTVRSRLRAHARSSWSTRATRVSITAVRDAVIQYDGEITRTRSMPDGVLRAGDTIVAEQTGARIPILTKPDPL